MPSVTQALLAYVPRGTEVEYTNMPVVPVVPRYERGWSTAVMMLMPSPQLSSARSHSRPSVTPVPKRTSAQV